MTESTLPKFLAYHSDSTLPNILAMQYIKKICLKGHSHTKIPNINLSALAAYQLMELVIVNPCMPIAIHIKLQYNTTCACDTTTQHVLVILQHTS